MTCMIEAEQKTICSVYKASGQGNISKENYSHGIRNCIVINLVDLFHDEA